MNYSKNLLLSMIATLSVVFLMTQCGGKKTESTEETTAVASSTGESAVEDAPMESKEKEAVCIWDNVSLRGTPDPKGTYITSVNLGEKVLFLGETAMDEKEKTYAKIRLGDGKEGWSRMDFIIPDATAAAFKEDTDIYGRPDLLTKTKLQFSTMDIVAVVEAKDDWSEVIGKRTGGTWKDRGWVKSSALTADAVDIATAKFGAQAMAKENIDDRFEALKALSENEDLSSSVFMKDIQEGMNNILEALDLPTEDAASNMVDSIAQ